jgi:hypothetical protein
MVMTPACTTDVMFPIHFELQNLHYEISFLSRKEYEKARVGSSYLTIRTMELQNINMIPLLLFFLQTMQENCMCKLRRKPTNARVHVMEVTTSNEENTTK